MCSSRTCPLRWSLGKATGGRFNHHYRMARQWACGTRSFPASASDLRKRRRSARPSRPRSLPPLHLPAIPARLTAGGSAAPVAMASRCTVASRQYIRQGQRMPQALLLPPQTLWEKVRGLQSSYEDTRPTAWKLVDRRSRRRIVPDVPLAQAMTAAPISPTVAAAVGAAERASVGIYAITGNVCPASGWWQCQESDALDGTRWLTQGSLLPAATFASRPGALAGRRARRRRYSAAAPGNWCGSPTKPTCPATEIPESRRDKKKRDAPAVHAQS